MEIIYLLIGSEVVLMCCWYYIFPDFDNSLQLGIVFPKRENLNDFLNQQFNFKKVIILENI
jgi:hypothetical protein